MTTRAAHPQDLRSTCWPDALEILLLRAGLCEMPKALAAWKEFCSRIVDLETLPESYYRLFPLLAGRLQHCDEIIPHQQRIAGVLRHAWARNQRLLAKIVPHLQALQDANIDFLLLKGAALVELYRQHGSVRPMSDLDILIHPEDVRRTTKLLQNRGCVAPSVSMEKLADLIRFRHELTILTETGSALDVHWHLVSDARHPEAQDRFWRDAEPCELGRLRAKSLDRTNQVLHACLHGAAWNEISPVRWLADCVMLIRAGIDWDRLETQARKMEHLYPVRETILILDQLDVGLSPLIVDHWRDIKITALEQAEGACRTRIPTSRERTRHLAWLYLRLHRDDSIALLLRSIPAYMRQLHHFRALSRRLRFLGYLLLFLSSHRTQDSQPCQT